MAEQLATEKTPTPPIPPERKASRQDTLVVDGQTITYTVTAETVHLPSDEPGGDGKAQAAVFATSYVVDGGDATKRPVTFCFNGGPGSSSVWLHMGALGPKRVEVPDAAMPAPPPYTVVDNPEGLLDLSDLVFIDPIGTGFSDAVGEGKRADYTQVAGDVKSVSAFIERWLTREGRWTSPKLLAGESYGTTRAAGVAHHLSERGIMFNGLLLISLALDFDTFIFGGTNELPLVLILPTYVATAAYHGLVDDGGDVPALLDKARAFARGHYQQALFAGASLSAARKAEVAAELAALTGVAADTWIRSDLRLDQARFCRELLAEQGKVVGRLDSRYVGRNDDPQAARASRDPSYDGPLGPFTVAVNEHLRRHIGYDDPKPYAIIDLKVNEGWTDDRPWWQGAISVSDRLRKAMIANPHMKVWVANGLLDLGTPFFASEYSVAHLGFEPELQANIVMADYWAGHMMYLHPLSRAQMRKDLVGFYGKLAP